MPKNTVLSAKKGLVTGLFNYSFCLRIEMLKREKPHPHQGAHTRRPSTHDERMKPASEKASSNSVYAGLVGTISFSAGFEPTSAETGLPVE